MTETSLTKTPAIQLAPMIAVLLISGVILDTQANVLNPLIGTMAAESRLSGSDIGWIINATMLGGVVSVGLTSRMGDRYGHRKILMGLTLLSFAGCILSATGTSFWPLVIGRFLAGLALGIPLGWGMLRPRGTARVIRHVSLALALTMAVFTPLSIVAGGALVAFGFPWQSVFWMTSVLFALLLLFAYLSPETPKEARDSVRIDWFGAIGIGIWVIALLIGISEGPSRGWTSPLVLGAFVVGVVVLFVWIVQQRRTREPLMSFKNMDLRQVLVGFSGLIIVSIVGPIVFIGLPLLLQTPTTSGFGLGLSPLESSYTLLAMIPGAAAGYVWTRWGLDRLGPKMVLVISGSAAILVYAGYALAHQTVWSAVLFVFGYAATILSCLTTGYALVASSGRQDNMAVTIGMQTIIQYTGATIPIAILLNVLAPGPDGYIQEAVFTGAFLVCSLTIALFVIGWAVFTPKRINDMHAIDALVDPMKISVTAG